MIYSTDEQDALTSVVFIVDLLDNLCVKLQTGYETWVKWNERTMLHMQPYKLQVS